MTEEGEGKCKHDSERNIYRANGMCPERTATAKCQKAKGHRGKHSADVTKAPYIRSVDGRYGAHGRVTLTWR